MFRRLLYNYIYVYLYKALFTTMPKAQELDLTNEKCLCLAPHADDESIGVGGTLLKYTDNFDVICLTEGYRGVNDGSLSREEKAEIRRIEFTKAMKFIGINSYKFLKEIPDRNLIKNLDFFKDMDISEYDNIFIPNLLDNHRDHKAVSIILRELLNTKNHKKDLKIIYYEVWSALPVFNAYVDISNIFEHKKELISLYQSQLVEYDYTEKTLGLNMYRGLPFQKNYVEAFYVADTKLFKKLCKMYLI